MLRGELMLDWIVSMDMQIIQWVSGLEFPKVLDGFMAFLTTIGNAGLVWIAIILLLLIFKKTRGLGIAAAIALILNTLLVNGILKPLVDRPRPFMIMEGIDLLIKEPSEPFSFPSGHASSSFAVAAALFFASHRNKYTYLAIALAALITLSRLYFCVHFPSDVIVGSVIGITMGYMGYRLYLLVNRKYNI